MNIKYWLSICICYFLMQPMSFAISCQPLLWPERIWINGNRPSVPKDILNDLLKQAKKSLKNTPKAIAHLESAGKTDIHDKTLCMSRLALQESDNAAVLALLYKLTHEQKYFLNARIVLLKWATINEPTGHPIDETRLQGLIWAYDLIACELATADKKIILTWLEKLRQKKAAWQFGKISIQNNHHTHQLKMLLLLDKVLKQKTNWQKDLNNAQKFATINLNSKTGISFDYNNRASLYYHNYDLQAWLEINLITNKHFNAVNKAFEFLSQQIREHHTSGEFIHSQAKIDLLRAKGGFSYAEIGGTFDVTRAAPTIITFYTMHSDQLSPPLEAIIKLAKPSPWLAFIKARRFLWQST